MSEQTKDGGQDLHARIMNIQWRAPSDCMTPTEHMGYSSGHRDARHAAAELAAEHGHALSLARSALEEKTQECDRMMAAINKRDERIAALEEALGKAVCAMELQEARESGRYHIGGEVMFGIWSDALRLARSVLNKENGNG